jgi:hypothetical protein
MFKLPGELRNHIYRYALVAPAQIEITKNNWQQPALLQVCHQIRTEASTIYYMENNFLVRAPYYDYSTYFNWYRYVMRFDQTNDVIQYLLSSSEPRWSCVKKRARLGYYDHVCINSNEPNASRKRNVVTGAFALVLECKDMGLSWDQAEKLLEKYKRGVDDAAETLLWKAEPKP